MLGQGKPEIDVTLLDRISRHTGQCLVATACRCHGVISGGFVKQKSDPIR